ncbi:hypothetical protein FHS28_003269 [Roseateles terrae]|uniref:N-acetyltransferase domain-containing protein n=1 Tax=Roseateles terrae TaxID=431060 RepID=A0ABR6GUU1_9BURK|nr:hypothetical protein [Roseateles terrae]
MFILGNDKSGSDWRGRKIASEAMSHARIDGTLQLAVGGASHWDLCGEIAVRRVLTPSAAYRTVRMEK